jgi:rhodanese-related sulfurtransferase
MTSPPSSIQPHQVFSLLGRADTPLIIDVRRPAAFEQSLRMLVGSIRVAPENIAAFAKASPPRKVIVYCVYGHEVSAKAAEELQNAQWQVQLLAGGFEGGQDAVDAEPDMASWRSQALPSLIKRPDWGVPSERSSRWITRERPKIDRIACPWLIKRFIDPFAEFYYVPTQQVFDEAERLKTIPYDIPGAPVSHEGPNGERCSFDALLKGFDLQIAALDKLAEIVRGADTDRLELVPQSAGLLALSLGMSALHHDDQTMLASMLPAYDALYAWCLQSVQGGAEGHRWQPKAA